MQKIEIEFYNVLYPFMDEKTFPEKTRRFLKTDEKRRTVLVAFV